MSGSPRARRASTSTARTAVQSLGQQPRVGLGPVRAPHGQHAAGAEGIGHDFDAGRGVERRVGGRDGPVGTVVDVEADHVVRPRVGGQVLEHVGDHDVHAWVGERVTGQVPQVGAMPTDEVLLDLDHVDVLEHCGRDGFPKREPDAESADEQPPGVGPRVERRRDECPFRPAVAGVHQEDAVAHHLVVLAHLPQHELAARGRDPLEDDRVCQRRTRRPRSRASTTARAAAVPRKSSGACRAIVVPTSRPISRVPLFRPLRQAIAAAAPTNARGGSATPTASDRGRSTSGVATAASRNNTVDGRPKDPVAGDVEHHTGGHHEHSEQDRERGRQSLRPDGAHPVELRRRCARVDTGGHRRWGLRSAAWESGATTGGWHRQETFPRKRRRSHGPAGRSRAAASSAAGRARRTTPVVPSVTG